MLLYRIVQEDNKRKNMLLLSKFIFTKINMFYSLNLDRAFKKLV